MASATASKGEVAAKAAGEEEETKRLYEEAVGTSRARRRARRILPRCRTERQAGEIHEEVMRIAAKYRRRNAIGETLTPS
jgi:hypothetical protein